MARWVLQAVTSERSTSGNVPLLSRRKRKELNTEKVLLLQMYAHVSAAAQFVKVSTRTGYENALLPNGPESVFMVVMISIISVFVVVLCDQNLLI